ncbi:hypothetical protein AGABI1DRAFT_64395 [Agaricus bisporus var. burnettii JB137-S8]|uniref:EF-hand domain-containing protein n=1 Tax=Agaricus bisporus var. burnettii (strain JB137-S8 / ATCC MYA-4627 / FGSC 10392) TaxID=597362 RepID=K5WXT4_AGABU|nr:uncharacterized protein AGABI1DRAFT_64395 [Agaricus bisporus var. burnettii JB137-S8]EKM75603.1 hypothetical protein AGABI1DRAFT_64395 [Agaricus bisporus var. burnettii JB137-S8]
MDFSRRENDRKVLAVKVQMQELMIVFFELRHVRNTEVGSDGTGIADRLKNFMLQVATDIKQCGSACDAYLKKGFLARTVKASIYESRLAEFAQKFVDHRSTLKLSLSLHTTIGVDAANAKLNDHGEMLMAIDKKLDMAMIFRKLDTPRERDVQKLIEERGGIKACLMNEEYLEELVAKSGDSLSRISGRSGGSGRRSNDLPEIRKRLLKEMQEDVDETFSRNMVLFERKLDMQNKQLSDVMRQQSDHIITALTAGAHDRINDPDLRKLWKDMGWKGSVKARTFVLNLHDYYADQRNGMNSSLIEASGLPSPLPMITSQLPSPRRKADDGWALEYINAAYVQSILEAVDDDGTGFISIKEVNTFVEERPAGWSLPEWFAFWAVGWQISVTQYKSKIYELVRSMFEMLDYVLPSNRRGVDEYLFHTSFWRIELLLRSTTPVNPMMLLDNDLVRYTEMYTAAEEKRLETNLEDVGYELDTTATVSLVTGEGRIERFVYPLVYLLLKRHLRILTLGCKHVLDGEEFVTLNESLVSVLLAIDTRIQNIEAVFKQTHFDIQARLGNFACGLFQLSYGDIRRIPAQITFGTWNNEEGTMSAPQIVTKDAIRDALAGEGQDILKYGHRDGFQSTDYFEFEAHRRRHLGPPHPLEGTWTGRNQLLEGEDTITYVLRISILVSNGKTVYGKGENFTNTFEFSGSVNPSKPGRRSKYNFSFALTDDEDGIQRSCYGQLDATTGVIVARWTDRREKEDPENIAYHEFILTRTPPSLTRYRYTDDAFAEDAARARWSFASAAVRHMVQQHLWSRTFLEERATERKRYVELSTRSLIVTMGLTPQKPLSVKEKGELDRLRRNLNPSEARFYQALADFDIQKLPWHPAWGCDWCERRITKARYLCVICMSDDLSDNIDLVSRDTFVCNACDAKRVPPLHNGHSASHSISHPLVRIRDTSLSGQSLTTEERLNALEQRLIMVEHKFADGFASSDAKLESRMAQLEAKVEERLNKLETYTEQRFDTLEAVMRQVMAQTMALPAIYGQVVRDTIRHSMPPLLKSPPN